MYKTFLTIFISSTLFAFNLEQDFNIKTYQVTKKNISNFQEYYGKLELNKAYVYDVNLRFDGFITKLYVPNEYTKITKGEKLFDVYSKEIFNLFDELRLAKNRSDNIYSSIVNKFRLYNIDPKNKTNNNQVTLKSEYNGYIFNHNINQGSYVKKGQNIFKIANIDTLWGIIDIYQKDLDFIKKGMSVELLIDGVSKIYQTSIDTIYPNIENTNQTVKAKVVIKNPEHKLFPNMFVKAKVFESSKSVLFIPKNALIQREGKSYVFFKEGKTYSPSEVEVKPIIGGYEVLEGLMEGDSIVSNALFLLDSDAITNGLYSDDW